MKKEKVSVLADQFTAAGEGRPVRTTLVLNENLSFALDCIAYERGIPKGELVRLAVRQLATEYGWDPSRIPSAMERLKKATARA